MSGVLSEAPGVSRPEAVPGKVFRSELNPVDFLHRTSTGKIQKFVLREHEWQGQDKRISGG